MDIITWLNAYPSRKTVLEMIICVALYFIVYTIKNNTKKYIEPHNKRFVYCNGSKRNIVYIDMVTQADFNNAETIIGYGIIDRNNTSIYFDLTEY